MAMSVFGCRVPRASRSISNASRYSGSASSYLPWVCSSCARISKVKLEVCPFARSAWSRALRSTMLSASRYSSRHWPQR
eukprot:scaffold6562_cov60-Phaeocystis_antarctica.AAC.7